VTVRVQSSWQRTLTYHSKTKHIDVQYHFVRDMVEDKKVFVDEGGHFEECCRFIDKVCEH
jgi:hypothetical protein